MYMGYEASIIGIRFFSAAEHSCRVKEVLAACDMEALCNENGDVVSIVFVGSDTEGMKERLNSIAEYVCDGSYIEMIGEDDARWRWVFTNGTLLELAPVMLWPTDDAIDFTDSSISVQLPNGDRVVAESKDMQDGYPGIRINLVRLNGTDETIAWVEYNKDREKENERVRILAWQKNGDEPVLNMGYEGGINDAD